MNGREYFHESVVKDVVDILTSLKDYDEVQFLQNSSGRRSFKSITSATKDLILTFPVLVSSDVNPDDACMVAKAHEKKCASLLHILFTAICVGSNEDVFDYVRKFHKNLGSLNGTLDSYADSLDQIAATLDENYEFKGRIDKDVLNTVLEELKESNYTLPDDVKESSLESFHIVPGYKTGTKDIIVNEAKRNKRTNKPNNIGISTVRDGGVGISTVRDGGVGSHTEYQGDVNVTYQAPTTTKYTINNGDSETDRIKSRKDLYDIHKNAIIDTEYKKANELMPTMMVINFMKSDENGNVSSNSMTAVIGVKAKIYPVSSMDICNHISSKVEDKNVLTNFIRATTNEIGFFRDFLFAIDKAKIDAKSYGRSASSNKLWKVLERRSTKSKFRRSLRMYNDATAISTLVLSENDVEYMKKNTNIDIMNVSIARKILDSYNFMCIAIVNESTETVSFLYDTGDDNYEKLTYSNLEREASDNSYKKMVNLLTKVSR